MSIGGKILVVDDTPVNVKLLGDLLTVKGYTVVSATSGKEALEKVDSERPDLVLLDVMMPGMTGYEVCRRLRESAANAMLPVVMVTALDPTQERVNSSPSPSISRSCWRACGRSCA
jgi:CheY-like chemotaxis protein